jgi:hypothetical protein
VTDDAQRDRPGQRDATAEPADGDPAIGDSPVAEDDATAEGDPTAGERAPAADPPPAGGAGTAPDLGPAVDVRPDPDADLTRPPDRPRPAEDPERTTGELGGTGGDQEGGAG